MIGTTTLFPILVSGSFFCDGSGDHEERAF